MKLNVERIQVRPGEEIEGTSFVGTLDITEEVFDSDDMLVAALNNAGYLDLSVQDVMLNEYDEFLDVEEAESGRPLIRLVLADTPLR